MPEHAPETISVTFRLGDFAELGNEPPDDPDSLESEVALLVTRTSEGLFRIEEPTSLSFIGPLGPMLDLGDVIEVEGVGTERCVCHRRVGKPRTWTRRTLLPGPHHVRGGWQWAIEHGRPREVLEQLSMLGARWEAAVGHLTVQGYLGEGESEAPPAIDDLLGELQTVLQRAVLE